MAVVDDLKATRDNGESLRLRWFEHTDRKCRCGKRATGILRGEQNESFGPHCERCAIKRLADSKKARDAVLAIERAGEPR